MQSKGRFKRLLSVNRKKIKQVTSGKGHRRSWSQSQTLPRRSLLKSAVAIGGVISIGMGIHLFDTNNRLRHDLGVIGAGRAVVVQVHDPSCPSCRQLMRSTEAVLTDMPHIDFRIADLTTEVGRELAARYRVGKVTLLLFDDRGKHLGSIQGAQSVNDLRTAFLQQFSVKPNQPDA